MNRKWMVVASRFLQSYMALESWFCVSGWHAEAGEFTNVKDAKSFANKLNKAFQ